MDEKERIQDVARYLEENLGVGGIVVEVDDFCDLVHVHNGEKPHCTIGVVSEIYKGAKLYVNGPSENDGLRRVVVNCLNRSAAYFPR